MDFRPATQAKDLPNRRPCPLYRRFLSSGLSRHRQRLVSARGTAYGLAVRLAFDFIDLRQRYALVSAPFRLPRRVYQSADRHLPSAEAHNAIRDRTKGFSGRSSPLHGINVGVFRRRPLCPVDRTRGLDSGSAADSLSRIRRSAAAWRQSRGHGAAL